MFANISRLTYNYAGSVVMLMFIACIQTK